MTSGKRWRRPKFSERNWDDPAYKEFRKKVYARDGGCCQWPKCGSTNRINIHHIKTWAKYPSLRFEVTNGICLCKEHHDFIWGKEEQYEQLFISIVRRNTRDPKDAEKRKKRLPITSRSRGKKGNAGKKQSWNERYMRSKRKRRK